MQAWDKAVKELFPEMAGSDCKTLKQYLLGQEVYFWKNLNQLQQPGYTYNTGWLVKEWQKILHKARGGADAERIMRIVWLALVGLTSLWVNHTFSPNKSVFADCPTHMGIVDLLVDSDPENPANLSPLHIELGPIK